MTYTLRKGKFAVRPIGTLGTCGWVNGTYWQVMHVYASSVQEAIDKVMLRFGR